MNGDFNLIWAVLALPVLGFLIQAFLGKRLAETTGKRLVGALAVAPILLAFAIAAKKLGRPVQDCQVIAPASDFPSTDGNPPLKTLVLHL